MYPCPFFFTFLTSLHSSLSSHWSQMISHFRPRAFLEIIPISSLCPMCYQETDHCFLLSQKPTDWCIFAIDSVSVYGTENGARERHAKIVAGGGLEATWQMVLLCVWVSIIDDHGWHCNRISVT